MEEIDIIKKEVEELGQVRKILGGLLGLEKKYYQGIPYQIKLVIYVIKTLFGQMIIPQENFLIPVKVKYMRSLIMLLLKNKVTVRVFYLLVPVPNGPVVKIIKF